HVPLPPTPHGPARAPIRSPRAPAHVPLPQETFRSFDPEALLGAARAKETRPEQLDAIARRCQDKAVLEGVLQHRAVADFTLVWLARRVMPELQDVLITNQARLLASPEIVESLFENPDLSTDIRRRADEFLEEFFLKKEREEGEPLAEAEEYEEPVVGVPAVPAGTPSEAAGPEEEVSRDVLVRLTALPVSQRIRIAFRGTREERLFLVRDTNRLVSTAVLKSPKTNEADAEVIANMKSVSEDVLRAVAQRREWMKKYSLMAAIVRNPRSPIDVTLPLVLRLSPRDQTTLSTDRNIPEAVRVTAKRICQRRQIS
ncbi:MAG: hypothetical protein KJ062_12535, partial [Thermoanaerobaculia bacterium]|nr:hypothetical protein [Thermoanaerobaculia bacterium]